MNAIATPIQEPIWMAEDPIAGRLMLDLELGMLYYVSKCCGASAKGTQDGVTCRNCYQPIPEAVGMAWMVDDEAAWVRYTERLLPELEHLSAKFAGRLRQRARELIR